MVFCRSKCKRAGIVLAEGAKDPILAERKFLRCFSGRADGSRNYVKPWEEIWLYLRKYADDEIKYFVSNAPAGEPDRAATLRRPIEQCFKECKSNPIDDADGNQTHAWDNCIYSN
ncbi:hypothetical protein ADH76_15255 [Enterocloster clostridioformis]|uniref:hypothetical protein n=1 Tax=Enterocloster clostridioformis TaxID=1531 RepID=UPI00080C6797|nr:hypothetical protein [Enterocloster clostridioformis]ANU46102.1 hypothetical protein A4V08_10090 [Lachnoclostridium sp. YL32]NDO30033.1 hypothetical protein [Enterocloster clostridioformis]OXE67402.1 hypothetical protein ADH76_15255 [Enterocloster clostridioformis]QQQ99149.1 hypothetical protein I5Q83_24505 [Enterocloster clostridioformis]